LTPDCPIANSYAPELRRICAAYEPRGIGFTLVYVDPDMNEESAQRHAREYGYTCAIRLDREQALARTLGATKVPEVVVVSPHGQVLYRGRIDDSYVELGKRRSEPTQRDLRNALDAILAGRPVPVAETPVVGCFMPPSK
jgi:hypothetical protein